MENLFNSLSTNPLFLTMGLALVILVFGYIAYKYVTTKKLHEIRTDVYKLFLEAERKYTVSGCGKQKMDYVIRNTYEILPRFVKFFVTEDMLRSIIQNWFVGVKDLLDDGKLNGSAKRY